MIQEPLKLVGVLSREIKQENMRITYFHQVKTADPQFMHGHWDCSRSHVF